MNKNSKALHKRCILELLFCSEVMCVKVLMYIGVHSKSHRILLSLFNNGGNFAPL